MNSPAFFPLMLPMGRQAKAIRLGTDASPAYLAKQLQIPSPSSVLMLSGGASLMSEQARQRLEILFVEVGKVLAQLHTTIIDGGTQAGVVALMGKALSHTQLTAPYIGVLPAFARAEEEPNQPKGEEMLEPHHSHFVLVESEEWGAEAKLMYGLADYLSQQVPSVALLVNGGSISLQEVEWNVRQGREVLVIAGSGRLADEIATAVDQPESKIRDRVSAVVRDGKITVFDLSAPVENLVQFLTHRLKSQASLDQAR